MYYLKENMQAHAGTSLHKVVIGVILSVYRLIDPLFAYLMRGDMQREDD